MTDMKKRKEILYELAHFLEVGLEQYDQAEEVYKEINEISELNSDASESLKRMYREQGRWEDLKNLCVKELKKLQKQDADGQQDENDAVSVQKVENLLILGELYEYQFNDLEKALASYEEVYTANPRNLASLKGLERIYRKQKQWDRLIEIYQKGIELAQDLKEEAYLYLRMGMVKENIALENDPEGQEGQKHYQESIRFLEAALLRDPDLSMALKALIPLYERTEDWDNVLRVRRSYAESLDDGLLRAEQYFRMAEVMEKYLEDETQAIEFI